jgi:hypothetical protein
MKLTGKKLYGVGLAGALFLGAGCNGGGESEPKTSKEEHIAEISRLTVERDLAATVLDAGQVQYEAYITALPENCRKAVLIFVPPEGPLTNISDEAAAIATEPWCGPDNLDATQTLRDAFDVLEEDRSTYEVLQLAIAQHLGALGVQPAPTTTQS